MKMQKKLLIGLFSILVVSLCVGRGILSSWAAPRGNVVVFSANWCASCREVIPLVREVASQNNLAVTEIDVDSQSAPRQARSLGLSIPSEEPPQVFLVDRGRSVLLYSGKGFRYGQEEAVRATILRNLQRALQ